MRQGDAKMRQPTDWSQACSRHAEGGQRDAHSPASGRIAYADVEPAPSSHMGCLAAGPCQGCLLALGVAAGKLGSAAFARAGRALDPDDPRAVGLIGKRIGGVPVPSERQAHSSG